jgi:nucleotide-binding universal stress UspA family protein
MKKILVPVDFSKQSENALEVAANLAHEFGGEITVLHMMGLSQSSLSHSESDGPEAMYYLKLAKKHFDSFLKKDYLKGLQVSQIVQNYKIFNEVNKVAQEQQADLIVMGSHGSSGFSEVFVGSNTEKVVRTSEIPVLVIKDATKDFLPKEIVFACDFKTENIKAYIKAMKLFKHFDANVHLVYVNLPNQLFKTTSQIDEMVEEFLYVANSGEMKNIDKVVYVCDYSAENGIFSYSEKIGADLIAIPTHGRRGLSHFFMGSKAELIANHAKFPVLTFKI